MRQWVEGWNNLDADLMEPLVSETYYGANGEGKNDLLAYVRQWKTNPENRVTFSLDEVAVQVEGDRASVRGVRADVNVKESDIIGQYKLDYSLQKEEGIWKITGAQLAS
jgi:ketosteroid isomerase-like protein